MTDMGDRKVPEFADGYYVACNVLDRESCAGLSDEDRELLGRVVERTSLGADMNRWYGLLHDADFLLQLEGDELDDYEWADPRAAIGSVLGSLRMYVDGLGLIRRKGE